MQLVVIVLYRVEQMEDLLVHFTEKGIHGATILESTGMATVLGNNEDLSMFGALRKRFNPERQESKTILTVLPDEEIPVIKKALEDVVGDINQPNTGIIFGFPISFAEGLGGLSIGD